MRFRFSFLPLADRQRRGHSAIGVIDIVTGAPKIAMMAIDPMYLSTTRPAHSTAPVTSVK